MDKAELEALRHAYQAADKESKRAMRPNLPPADMRFSGVVFHADPRDNWTELQLWLNGRPPEPKSVARLIDAVAGKKALVLDIGANCGAYSLPLANAAGPNSRVLAFEPNPVMVGRLGRNILRNDLGRIIRVEAVALGAQEGEATLRIRSGNLGQSSINPDSGARGRQFTVPLRPLKSYLRNLSAYDVSVLKIDIEGAEDAVLRPWLDDAQPDARPDLVLMETRHQSLWHSDLSQGMVDFGYRSVFEGEGNTLFERT